jgi:hypothetical protein
MAESTLTSETLVEASPRRLQLRRVWDLIIHPRATLAELSQSERAAWLTPLLLVIGLLIVRVLVSAPLKAAQLETGTPANPNFQYYTPEQQAQLQQALAAIKGPVFQYVFPIGGAAIGALLLWSITAGLLYLISTLQGGRGSMTRALNLVAWASVPTIIHLIVQIVYVQGRGQLIVDPGLSGFALKPPDGSLFVRALLSRIDLYLAWHAVLLVIGLRLFTGLARGKAWTSVLITLAAVMLLRVVPDLLAAQFSGLTVIQPFLF